ncbi:TRAP-type C4-dicarboxylate transport system, small permease component [Roseovarius azorensis]|uniref:TRAP transporter small permease protein n=1 Tax=Roseovarius azorensis TaxID=1287727 RepID=A0A1H7X3Y3_9RHOB|nr:TRAP transporter small permease [Roseovarius azorensis]SEM28580.1 TRAP-type C4-dicarboxylate transport system, small permease component [Roseovarius azorensis]
MDIFLRFETVTTRIALWLAVGFLLTSTALAMYQVTARFLLGNPSTWSEVITRSAMIWSVLLGVGPAFRHGSMISVEIIQRALPMRLGLGLYQVSLGLTLIFFGVLFWQGWAMAQRVVSQKLAALEVSISWVYAALPVGSVFIMIAVLGCMLRASRGEWAARSDPQPEAMQ